MRASKTSAVPVAIAVLAGALIAATLSDGSIFQVGAAAVVVVASTLVLLRQVGRPKDDAASAAHSRSDVVVVCWLVLVALPPHNFVQQSSAGALTAVSASSVIEVCYFSVVLVYAAKLVRELGATLDRARPPARLFVVPLWVVVSASWSASPAYALVRGYQFAVIGVLGWATVLVVRDHSRGHDLVVARFMRGMIGIVTLLAISGFVLGPIRSPASEANIDRFAWIAAHPNTAGPLLVIAFLFLVIAGDTLRIPIVVRYPVGVLLAVGIYDNQSRASMLALVGVGALLLVRAVRNRPHTVALWTPFVLLGGYLLWVLESEAVWDYVSRGQSSDRVATGNGRRGLWVIGFNSLDGPFDWLAGHGYGVTRTLFLPEEPWAGTAHNSILAMLVGLGLVGIVVFLGMYGLVARDVVSIGSIRSRPLIVGLVVVVVAALIDGMASDRLAEPTDGYALMVLLASIALTSRPVATAPQDTTAPTETTDTATSRITQSS